METRRRLLDGSRRGSNDSGEDVDKWKSTSKFGTTTATRTTGRSFLFPSDQGDPLLDSPGSASSHPISQAFSKLQDMTYGNNTPPISHSEILYKPETQFDKIVQKSKEYLIEADCSIAKLTNVKDMPEETVMDMASQIERTIQQVSYIAESLNLYLEEATVRQCSDGFVSPRVASDLKANELALKDLSKTVKECKRSLQRALVIRERKDLLNDWTSLDRAKRVRDAEELMSDSTERLLNSKRILLETIQASSGTLGSLATSSQSIQKNDEELYEQSDMVGLAGSLLKKYGRRAQTDKISIWLGFVFFACVVLIVVYRRLF